MKIKNILFILLAIFVFSACNDDTEPRVSADGIITFDPIGVDELELTRDNLKEAVLTLNWSSVEPNVSIVSTYAVQIDTLGGDFSNAPLFADSKELTVGVIGTDLNNILTKSFNQEPETTANYELRIVLAAKNKDGKLVAITGSGSVPQAIALTATYAAPDNLYMIGTDPFGGWDWSSNKIVTMTPVHGKTGEFWTVKYITKDDKFKWAPSKEWKNDFAKLEKLEGYEIAEDGNGVVTKNDLYMIYINYLEGVITVEPAKINGMGIAFGDNKEGKSVFTIEGNLAKITTKAKGELRISASSSAQTSDWWTREFILIDGKIEYRGNGDDQDRVEVKAGQVITLNFNENTGTIE